MSYLFNDCFLLRISLSEEIISLHCVALAQCYEGRLISSWPP